MRSKSGGEEVDLHGGDREMIAQRSQHLNQGRPLHRGELWLALDSQFDEEIAEHL